MVYPANDITPQRDLLFISYATEQSALADWLARRLAAEGYAVWQDRLKMLGGENWPNDIDKAINERTFRMIALLSRASMQKANPQGEWLKGRAIGNRLGIEDFVIPLNTEGLPPHEITWNYQPITYIPFWPSWADGLAALLSKLESINAPRTLSDGRQLAGRSMAQTTTVLAEPELVASNCFEVLQVPRFVRLYELARAGSAKHLANVRHSWPHWAISPSRFLAFGPPLSDSQWTRSLREVGEVDWGSTRLVDGFETLNVVKSLIHRCLEGVMESRGMKFNHMAKRWYLPMKESRNPRLRFTLPNGQKSSVSSGGERTFWSSGYSEKYRYYLSPSFSLLRDQIDPFVLMLRTHIYLTDVHGRPLERQKAISRRKHLCKDWFNEQWTARTLAMAQSLADDDTSLRYGPSSEQQLVISAIPISLEASKRLLDELADQPDDYLMGRDDDQQM